MRGTWYANCDHIGGGSAGITVMSGGRFFPTSMVICLYRLKNQKLLNNIQIDEIHARGIYEEIF